MTTLAQQAIEKARETRDRVSVALRSLSERKREVRDVTAQQILNAAQADLMGLVKDIEVLRATIAAANITGELTR